MPDQPSAAEPAPRHAEWVVLDLLLNEARPWSLAEIGRELGDDVEAVDAVAELHAAGLVHRTSDRFAFVSRAATRYYEIAQ
jgi:hypothetical protein